MFLSIFSNTVVPQTWDEEEQDDNSEYLALKPLVKKYGRVVIFDIETSGLSAEQDSIIEFGGISLALDEHGKLVCEESGFYIRYHKSLDTQIVAVTGISDSILRQKGIDRGEAEEKIIDFIFRDSGVVCAYNAQFDLSFVNALLVRQKKTELLKTCCYLDIMTIYKDRAAYPHKLANAMTNYNIPQARMHDAKDDTKSEAAVLCKMTEEHDDIEKYLNLFGYNPKYGVNGVRLNVIYYAMQPYNSRQPLYEIDDNLGKGQAKLNNLLCERELNGLSELLDEVNNLPRIVILKREFLFLRLYEEKNEDHQAYEEEEKALSEIIAKRRLLSQRQKIIGTITIEKNCGAMYQYK